MARPVGGWRKGERPAFRGAACSRGRGIRAVSRLSAAPTLAELLRGSSPGRGLLVPPGCPSPFPPGASLRPCPGAVGRPRLSAGSDHRRLLAGRSACGAGRPPPHPVPLAPCSPSRRPRPWASARSPLPGFGCAVCGRSGARAGAGRPSSGAAGGGASGWLSAARSARKRPRGEAGRAAGPAAGLARLFLRRCEHCHEQQLTSIVKAYLEED